MWRALILAGVLFSSPGWSQTTPLALVKQFFAHQPMANKQAVYTGEMTKQFVSRPSMGERLPSSIEKSYRLLQQTDDMAVYAVVLQGFDESQDWYVYLLKQSQWKLAAIRTLGLPDFFYNALTQLASKKNRTKQEQALYRNMQLTAAPDSQLKQYLLTHLSQFKQMVDLVNSDPQQANSIAKTLHLNFIKPADGRLDINIGGIGDNAVGYMYVPDGASPPAMKANHYIYVEQIKGHWYLYKTT